jgi:uncharacterized membrane protein
MNGATNSASGHYVVVYKLPLSDLLFPALIVIAVAAVIVFFVRR